MIGLIFDKHVEKFMKEQTVKAQHMIDLNFYL